MEMDNEAFKMGAFPIAVKDDFVPQFSSGIFPTLSLAFFSLEKHMNFTAVAKICLRIDAIRFVVFSHLT